jgi:hypothetical protein
MKKGARFKAELSKNRILFRAFTVLVTAVAVIGLTGRIVGAPQRPMDISVIPEDLTISGTLEIYDRHINSTPVGRLDGSHLIPTQRAGK